MAAMKVARLTSPNGRVVRHLFAEEAWRGGDQLPELHVRRAELLEGQVEGARVGVLGDGASEKTAAPPGGGSSARRRGASRARGAGAGGRSGVAARAGRAAGTAADRRSRRARARDEGDDRARQLFALVLLQEVACAGDGGVRLALGARARRLEDAVGAG